MSDFSAIGSKMSVMTIDDDSDNSSRDHSYTRHDQKESKPVSIWNANESGRPIQVPVPIEIIDQKQEQSRKIDRRKIFASMKMKKRNRSNDSVKTPPLSTVVLNSDANETKESNYPAPSSYNKGSMYIDSLGTFNPENVSNYRSSFHSKSIGNNKINQSTRSGMSALTMMSTDSIGTSIDLLSVCEVLQNSIKSDIEGNSGGNDVLHEISTWNSNRSGFSGPPISILARAGPSEGNEDTWMSKNTLFSKDSLFSKNSLFSNSTNSKSSSQHRISGNNRSQGKPPAARPGFKVGKKLSLRSNMSKNLSDLSMGTGINTPNLSATSLVLDDLEDTSQMMDDPYFSGRQVLENGGKRLSWQKLPTIEGSNVDFDASHLEMDID